MNYFSAIFIFPDNTKARFVKLHSLWDERDLNYSPLDFSSFKGNPWNLFEVYYLANGKEFSCSYDSRGNRLSEVESFSSYNASKIYFEYYQNSDLIKKAGNWYFNYDNNGNLLSRGNVVQYSNTDTFCSWDFAQKEGELWVYEYDLQNRLIKTSYSGKGKTNLKERASYTYDYRGLLVRKSYQDYDKSNYIELDNPTSSKEITEYYEYTSDGRVIYNERKDNTIVNKTDYIWANTTLWCEVTKNDVYYHHTDHLGTTEVITDSNGNIVWHADYEAFGNVMNERGDENFTPNYTGKFFDESSGLYYFNARWYDCELGRFTTQDPARDGVNWWIYCGGNPITITDPNGRESEYFNYNNYVKGRLFGEANVISAGIQNFFGEIGNFASNIIKGNCTVESYYDVSVSFGNFEYSGTMYVDSSNANVSFEFTNPTQELSNALQSSLGMPVTFNSNGFDADIPLGDYYAVGVSVPVSCSNNGDKASLSLGLKGSLKSPVLDKGKGSASTGFRISASVQSGPCGTIKNRQNESINKKVDTYNYYSSPDFLLENVE